MNIIETEDYLINQLETGRKLKIVLISHNSIWQKIEKYSKKYSLLGYDNLDVAVFGDTYSIGLYKNEPNKNLDNTDLIVYYSSDYYNEYKSNYLQDLASNLSFNKRVSFLYSHVIPVNQSPDNITRENIIISFKDDEKKQEEVRYLKDPYDGVYDTINLALASHDSYDIEEKIRKKTNL